MQIFVSLVCLMFSCDFGFLLPERLQLTFLFFTSLLPCGQLYEYCALDLDKCLVKPANRDGRRHKETDRGGGGWKEREGENEQKQAVFLG